MKPLQSFWQQLVVHLQQQLSGKWAAAPAALAQGAAAARRFLVLFFSIVFSMMNAVHLLVYMLWSPLNISSSSRRNTVALLEHFPQIPTLPMHSGVTATPQQCVAVAAADGFAPNLVFYGPGELLPSGTPGDPAAEYNKRAARKCGPLKSGKIFASHWQCTQCTANC